MLPTLLVLVLAATPPAGAPETPEEAAVRALPLERLVACTPYPPDCELHEWDLARELARRMDVAELVARAEQARERAQRTWVFAVYAAPPSPSAAQLMRRLSHHADDEVAYYALNYGVKRCEPEALAEMTRPPYEMRAGCLQWAPTVAAVSRCRYAPAAEFLVESLHAACLNIVDAAVPGLRALFPGSPRRFDSMEALQTYFARRLAQQRRRQHK